jgi:hypothetical protein
MKSKGYVLTIGNVSMNDDCPYEDWYVHPDLVEFANFDEIQEANKKVVNVGKYFYEE